MTDEGVIDASDTNDYESWRLLCQGDGAFLHEDEGVLIAALTPIATGRRDAPLDIREAGDDRSFSDVASVLAASCDIPVREAESAVGGARRPSGWAFGP